MEIILLKTPIFKFSDHKNGMPVPGFAEFTQQSVTTTFGEDWLLGNTFRKDLAKIREKIGNRMNDFSLKFTCKSLSDLNYEVDPFFGASHYEATIELQDRSTILREIKEKLFPNHFVKFEAAVSMLGFPVPESSVSITEDAGDILKFTAKEMRLDRTTNSLCYKDTMSDVPHAVSSICDYKKGKLFAMVTVSMTISKFDLDRVKSPSIINRSIFTEELGSDTAIIPGNGGNPVKCHRSFLMANSPVFRAMFQTDMEEAKSCKVEIEEMSEDVVRAFLAYLYYRDESQAILRFRIAFQLLMAGHKYQIPDLVNAMSAILIYKPIEWYDDVNLAVKQYLFARNLEDGNDLKIKALIAMKMERAALQKCTTFRNLFKDNTDVAMEMFEDMAGVENQ